MQKLCGTLSLLVASISAFGQGCVSVQNPQPIGREHYIYGVDPADPTSRVLSGQRERLAGSGYSAQLFWGPVDASETQLKAVEGSLSTFRTGPSAGLITGLSKVCIPGTLGGAKVTLQVRAWDNRGGTILTWDSAIAEPDNPRGQSTLITNWELAGVDAENVPHVGSGYVYAGGLQSFGLYIVPEPSIAVMGVLGLGALLLRWRVCDVAAQEPDLS